MYRFLLSRQWVILTLLGLVLIPTMIKLGFWQLHRHEARVARNEEVAAALHTRTVPVTELTGRHRGPSDKDKFRPVTARGTFDEKHEVVVRHRTAADGDTIGYFVVTPLVLKDGSALLVNRGWIRADRDLTAFPDVPPAPRGEVTVRGRMMPDETTEASGIKDTKGLPDRQVMLINSRQQEKRLHQPVLRGFVQLTSSSPKGQGKQPEVLPEPDHSGIGPHMAYAVQWWLFTGAVPVGWVILVRREAQERRRKAEGGTAPGGGTTATGPGPDHDPDAGSGSGSGSGSGNEAPAENDAVENAARKDDASGNGTARDGSAAGDGTEHEPEDATAPATAAAGDRSAARAGTD
ncbi:SURF1 family protein [Streptomyces cacaoi]|uniref:SURF1 family cytochrome oxidase biogenesis protein n=1 Tax=Streptomyces cacaoi TaxID=1898 RepID=UPI00314546EA